MLSEQTYRSVVLEDGETLWELHHGRLKEKPRMGAEHNDLMARLAGMIAQQLDWKSFRLRINSTHVRKSRDSYYIPDLFVVAAELFREQLGQPRHLEVYELPLDLVVEIWSLTTGDYDISAKLPEYQARGDREIWFVHPYEKTIKVWSKLSDGSYMDTLHSSGIVYLAGLPDVSVDLSLLFDFG